MKWQRYEGADLVMKEDFIALAGNVTELGNLLWKAKVTRAIKEEWQLDHETLTNNKKMFSS